jgi:hypothetical protein
MLGPLVVRSLILHCVSPLLAQSRHPDRLNQCLLLEVRRTWFGSAPMSAYDPKRTLAAGGREQ